MDLKSQVLETLEKNKGTYISGRGLAETLFVSRNAVWKAVKALQDEGHRITAVTNKGYCLEADSDILSKASVEKYLGPLNTYFNVEVYKALGSTNTALKEKAASGAPEGTVIVAEEQTSGRGRLGRSFYSPAGTGIYFSILLRPTVRAADATLLTTAAAVAVAEAIEAVTGAAAQIKWVNDVFCAGKKVCGILTEGAFDMESGGMEYVVVGIGLNVIQPTSGFPDELNGVASAVCSGAAAEAGLRSRLIAEIVKMFWGYYMKLGDKGFLKAYKERSLIIGREIEVLSGSNVRRAKALSIDDDCRLVVKFQDGAVEALSSGEVSIKPVKGEEI